MLGNLEKAVVVGTRHDYINIVVPRDNAMMTHCPYRRTRTAIVSQPVLVAYLHESLEYVEDSGVPPVFHLFYIHIAIYCLI